MALQVLLHSLFLGLVCLFGMRDLQRMDAAVLVLSRSNSVDEPVGAREPYTDGPKSRPSSPCVEGGSALGFMLCVSLHCGHDAAKALESVAASGSVSLLCTPIHVGRVPFLLLLVACIKHAPWPSLRPSAVHISPLHVQYAGVRVHCAAPTQGGVTPRHRDPGGRGQRRGPLHRGQLLASNAICAAALQPSALRAGERSGGSNSPA
jgi:hypothetical protein